MFSLLYMSCKEFLCSDVKANLYEVIIMFFSLVHDVFAAVIRMFHNCDFL